MLGLPALAKQHRSMFYSLVAELGQTIQVRSSPATSPTALTDVERALGVRLTSTSTAQPIATDITAIITGPTSIPLSPNSDGMVAPVGLLQSSDVVLRVKVIDVLLDEDDPYGLTMFDTAHDVVIGNSRFKVSATERSGLPPLTPYILWVGLLSEGAL